MSNNISKRNLKIKSEYVGNTVIGLNNKIVDMQVCNIKKYQFEDGPVVNSISIENINDLFSIYINPGDKERGLFNGFIFRGQSEAKYELIPSILRLKEGETFSQTIKNNRISNLFKSHGEDECDEYIEHILYYVEAEKHILFEFFKLCDRNGMELPNISVIRENMLDISNYSIELSQSLSDNIWPHNDWLELMSLAQHYGLPTSLLDWTYNPYIALYFACSSNYKNDKSEGFMSLYAFNYRYTDFLRFTEEKLDIRFTTPPTYLNRNLYAQSGVLSCIQYDLNTLLESDENNNLSEAIIKNVPIPRKSYEQYLNEVSERFDRTILYKINIPKRFSEQTLYLLDKLGYSTSRIFPGYKGAADEILEKIDKNLLSAF